MTYKNCDTLVLCPDGESDVRYITVTRTTSCCSSDTVSETYFIDGDCTDTITGIGLVNSNVQYSNDYDTGTCTGGFTWNSNLNINGLGTTLNIVSGGVLKKDNVVIKYINQNSDLATPTVFQQLLTDPGFSVSYIVYVQNEYGCIYRCTIGQTTVNLGEPCGIKLGNLVSISTIKISTPANVFTINDDGCYEILYPLDDGVYSISYTSNQPELEGEDVLFVDCASGRDFIM